jgi:hypothetical protein
MSQKGDIYLGASGAETLLSPFGRKLKISDVILGREEQTASGRRVRDIIATKKKITLTYEMIDGDELDMLIGLYEDYDELSLLLYNDTIAGTTTPEAGDDCDSYTVLMQPIERERVLLLGNGLYGNVVIELNEV